MKFLFVIPSWSYRGGERIFINLASALKDKGHEVVVVAGRKEENLALKPPSKLEIVYPTKFNKLLQNDVFSFFFGWIFILNEIRQKIKDTDWIISESNNCLYASVLASLFRPSKVAWYVMAYEPVHHQAKALDLLWEATFGLIERLCLLRVEKIMALAPRVEEIVAAKFGKNSLVLNPIVEINGPISKSKVRKDILDVYKNHRVLFLPGAFHWKKNQRLALEVLAGLGNQYPDLRLVLAGAGKDEEHLKNLAEKLAISNKVFLAGVIKGDTLAFCYKNAILTLACSLSENEGLSLTSLESLTFNTPVLVSSEAGVSRIIKENGLGLVAKPNPTAFTGAVKQVFGNPQDVKQMTGLGQKYVSSNFSQEKVVDYLLQTLSPAD